MSDRSKPQALSKRELQRAASVARIVEAAEGLLAESSQFSDIYVEHVISRAGVARSTFYSYFDDMGHVLRVVGEGVVAEVVSSARAWMDLDIAITPEQLRSAFTQLVTTYRRRAKLMAALADASTYDPAVRDDFHRLFAIGLDEVAKHIRRAQDSGAARPDIDPEPTAAWLVWMIERGLYQHVRPASAGDLPRIVDALASIVWQSLYAPASSPAEPTNANQ